VERDVTDDGLGGHALREPEEEVEDEREWRGREGGEVSREGDRSNAVACRNAEKSWSDESASVDSTPTGRSGCAGN
jgi:hypothetical protein